MTKEEKIAILDKIASLKESDKLFVLGYATACLAHSGKEKTA